MHATGMGSADFYDQIQFNARRGSGSGAQTRSRIHIELTDQL